MKSSPKIKSSSRNTTIKSHLSKLSKFHQVVIDEAVKRAEAYSSAKGFLILDLDDVLFDTRPRIYAELSLRLQELNPSVVIPTLEDVRRGIRKSFETLFDSSDATVFAEIHEEIITRPSIYKNAPFMYENLPEVLQQLISIGFIPIMCLSARTEKIMKLSRKEVQRLGLDLPVFAMYLGDDTTATMKIEIIFKIVERLPSKKIYMIDDDERTIMKVMELNQSYPDIIGILYDTLALIQLVKHGKQFLRY